MRPLGRDRIRARTRSTAFLRCFNQPIPETWELQTELEANQAAGEVDYAVEEQLEELGFEVEEKSFAEELTEMAKFDAVSTDDQCGNCVFWTTTHALFTRANATSRRVFFNPLPTPMNSYCMLNLRASACGNCRKMTAYALSPVPRVLQQQLDEFLLHRTSVFAARRTGGAVVSSSADGDKQARARTSIRTCKGTQSTTRGTHRTPLTACPRVLLTRRCFASSDTLTS